MRLLLLVKDCIISCSNHPVRGDYNTEVPIFKMATAQFLNFSKEEINKIKENIRTAALIITSEQLY